MLCYTSEWDTSHNCFLTNILDEYQRDKVINRHYINIGLARTLLGMSHPGTCD